jgi:hypothetical protein
MTKDWTCTRCRRHVSRGIVGDLLDGAPDECEASGNTEFTSVVLGSVHPVVDSLRS